MGLPLRGISRGGGSGHGTRQLLERPGLGTLARERLSTHVRRDLSDLSNQYSNREIESFNPKSCLNYPPATGVKTGTTTQGDA